MSIPKIEEFLNNFGTIISRSYISERLTKEEHVGVTKVKEAAAIASYHNETGISIVELLLCDDAPQFKLLTCLLSLCWVHYKRLSPLMPMHQEQLTAFMGRYWNYYKELFNYKRDPTTVTDNHFL